MTRPGEPPGRSDLTTNADVVRSKDATERFSGKVAVLTHYLPPYMARVLYHVQQQIGELKILLSIDQEPNRDFGDTWAGLDVEVQKSLMLRRPWRHSAGFTDELFVHFPYDTIARLRKIDPDIVFSYELGFRSLKSAVYSKLYRKKLALCVCVSEHTEQGRGVLRHLLRKYLLRTADAVTYNGPSCLNYLRRFRIPESKLYHFPYSPSDQFQYSGPLDRPSAAQRRLLYIGQLSQRKGILPMLETLDAYCRQHPAQQIELDLLGDGPIRERLQNWPCSDNFRMRLLGHMSQQEIAEQMAATGVLIFPTMADEWGLVVNEALQAGMPVIGSRYAQAVTTLIQEGVNGWQYFPDQPAQLHEKLDILLRLSEEKLHAMRLAAQKSVAHITSSAAAESAVRMLKSLLTDSHNSATR